MFEKEALDDFDLMMMPSTASAACDNTITATSATDFLKTWRYLLCKVFIISTNLT
jgi:hypothetical protein